MKRTIMQRVEILEQIEAEKENKEHLKLIERVKVLEQIIESMGFYIPQIK